MGEVFELEIDTLETKCYFLDPTPVANCTVRPLTEHVSAPFRVTAGGAPARSLEVIQPAGPFYPALQPAFRAHQGAVAKITI